MCVSVWYMFVHTQYTDKHAVMYLVILLYRTLVHTLFRTHCIRYVYISSDKMCMKFIVDSSYMHMLPLGHSWIDART